MNRPSRGRARIGVLVPFTNSNLEPDMVMLCPQGISIHYARMGGYDVDKIPDENQMATMGATDLSESLRLLAAVKPDVILYGCTSATLTHGPGFDKSLSDKVFKDWSIPTVTAAGALITALQAIQVNKIGFASPYVENINNVAIEFLQTCGFETVSSAHIEDKLDNYEQGNLSPEKVYDLAIRANSDKAQTIVLSCTDMRAVEVINQLEGELKKPIITSNQAMLFAALRHINVSAHEIDFGRLFKMENK